MENSAESAKETMLDFIFGFAEILIPLLLIAFLSYLYFFKPGTYETPFDEGYAYYNNEMGEVATEAYGIMIHAATLEKKKWLIIAMPKYKGTYLEDENTVSFLQGYIQAMQEHFPNVTFADKPNYYVIERTIAPGILITLRKS